MALLRAASVRPPSSQPCGGRAAPAASRTQAVDLRAPDGRCCQNGLRPRERAPGARDPLCFLLLAGLESRRGETPAACQTWGGLVAIFWPGKAPRACLWEENRGGERRGQSAGGLAARREGGRDGGAGWRQPKRGPSGQWTTAAFYSVSFQCPRLS